MQRPVISVIIAVLSIVIIAVIVFFWQQCTSDTSESGLAPVPVGPRVALADHHVCHRHAANKDTPKGAPVLVQAVPLDGARSALEQSGKASLCFVPGNSLTLALGPPRLRRVKV